MSLKAVTGLFIHTSDIQLGNFLLSVVSRRWACPIHIEIWQIASLGPSSQTFSASPLTG